VPLHRVCRHRAGGAIRDRSAARPRHRARAGWETENFGAGRLGRSVHDGANEAQHLRPAASELPPTEAAASIGSIPDFVPATVLEQHFNVPHPPAQVFAMFDDIAAVAAWPSRRVVDGAA